MKILLVTWTLLLFGVNLNAYYIPSAEDIEPSTEPKPLTDRDVKEAFKTRSYLFDQMRQRSEPAIKRMIPRDSMRRKREAELPAIPDPPQLSGDAYIPPKTYGMNLNPERGFIWNNLNNPGLYFELARSQNGDQIESQKDVRPPPPVPAYSDSDSSEDIYVSNDIPLAQPLASELYNDPQQDTIVAKNSEVENEEFNEELPNPVPVVNDNPASNENAQPPQYQSEPVLNDNLKSYDMTQEESNPVPEILVSENPEESVENLGSNGNPALVSNDQESRVDAAPAEPEDNKKIPEAPVLPPMNYDNLPDYIREAISSTEKAATYEQTDNPYVNPQLDAEDKKEMDDKMEEIFATVQPVEDIPRTYGLNLSSDGGHVWNDLVDPPVSIDVGSPNSNQGQISKESITNAPTSEQPEIQTGSEPIEPAATEPTPSVAPETPFEPKVPTENIEPVAPVEPNPDEPIQPLEPVAPFEPTPPTETEEPKAPVETNPDEPIQPLEPVAPFEPTPPIESEGRFEPTAPTETEEPKAPVEPNPDEPIQPLEPVAPFEPTPPIASEGPFEPTAPTETEEPKAPFETNPDEPIQPLEPVAPFEPTPPIASEGPFEPTAPTETEEPKAPFETNPDEPIQPLQPVAPFEPTPPNAQEKPFEPKAPTENIEPVAPAETNPDEPIQPLEPVAPFEPTPPDAQEKPFEPKAPTDNIEPMTPVEPNPDEPIQPLEPVAPFEPTPPDAQDKPFEPKAPTENIEPVAPVEPKPDESNPLGPFVPTPNENPEGPIGSLVPVGPTIPLEPRPEEPIPLEPTGPIESTTLEPEYPDESVPVTVQPDEEADNPEVNNPAGSEKGNTPKLHEPSGETEDQLEDEEHKLPEPDAEDDTMRPDIMNELLKSEQFWKWLGEWTATYMELLDKHIRKIAIQEICNHEKTGSDICRPVRPEETGPAIKDGKLFIDGKEIAMTHTDNLSLLRRRPESSGSRVDATNIYGNSVGNEKVTNVFIFNPDQTKEILEEVKPENGSVNFIIDDGIKEEIKPSAETESKEIINEQPGTFETEEEGVINESTKELDEVEETADGNEKIDADKAASSNRDFLE